MIDEILCAFSVRRSALAPLGLVSAAFVYGCGPASTATTESELNAAVRRVQQHEADIESCACAAGARGRARAICDEADQTADADLRARCHQALHRVEAIPSSAGECECE